MNQPLVSIIVPCYNQAQYLDECLQSVLDQAYHDWECIIVNDGSPDNTEEVARNWLEKDKRFKYVAKQNGGLSSARNAGLEHARGEYIQLLDADDLIEKDKIKNQINYLIDNPDLALTYGSSKFFFNDNISEFKLCKLSDGNWTKSFNRNNKKILDEISNYNIMVVSAPLIRKSVIIDVGLFDPKLKSLEDWDYWIRVLIKGDKIEHKDFNNSFSLIRVSDNSMMSNTERMKYYELCVRLKHFRRIPSLKTKIAENIIHLYKLKYGNKQLAILKLIPIIFRRFSFTDSLVLLLEISRKQVKLIG